MSDQLVSSSLSILAPPSHTVSANTLSAGLGPSSITADHHSKEETSRKAPVFSGKFSVQGIKCKIMSDIDSTNSPHGIYKHIVSFGARALICPLVFGGSFLDTCVAGFVGFCVTCLRSYMGFKDSVFLDTIEMIPAVLVPFVSRGLGIVASERFSYSNITSASIISLLPGFLILMISLEKVSQNTLRGSVRMVQALLCTILLGLGLELASKICLSLESNGRQLAENSLTSYSGLSQIPVSVSEFTFAVLKAAGYRQSAAWYLQPFPFWAQFIIVPVLSVLVFLAKDTPVKRSQLLE